MEQIEEAGLGLCMKLPGIALYGIYKLFFSYYAIWYYGNTSSIKHYKRNGFMGYV